MKLSKQEQRKLLEKRWAELTERIKTLQVSRRNVENQLLSLDADWGLS